MAGLLKGLENVTQELLNLSSAIGLVQTRSQKVLDKFKASGGGGGGGGGSKQGGLAPGDNSQLASRRIGL